MRHPTTQPPPADGGYPADRDLQQMTDDGGLPAPGRAGETGGRDNLGELDTFAAEVQMGFPARVPPAPAESHWERLQRGIEVTERWRAACRRLAGR